MYRFKQERTCRRYLLYYITVQRTVRVRQEQIILFFPQGRQQCSNVWRATWMVHSNHMTSLTLLAPHSKHLCIKTVFSVSIMKTLDIVNYVIKYILWMKYFFQYCHITVNLVGGNVYKWNVYLTHYNRYFYFTCLLYTSIF